jgi:hypothetical protein
MHKIEWYIPEYGPKQSGLVDLCENPPPPMSEATKLIKIMVSSVRPGSSYVMAFKHTG